MTDDIESAHEYGPALDRLVACSKWTGSTWCADNLPRAKWCDGCVAREEELPARDSAIRAAALEEAALELDDMAVRDPSMWDTAVQCAQRRIRALATKGPSK